MAEKALCDRPSRRDASGERASALSPKARQKRLNGAVDGRSLRATGRTEHLNFKALPEIKEAVDKAAAEAGITKSLWLERAILAAIKAQENGGHA